MRKFDLSRLFLILSMAILTLAPSAAQSVSRDDVAKDTRFKPTFDRFQLLIKTQDDSLVKRLPYGKNTDKYVVMSDWHLGNSRRADYFGKNIDMIGEVLKYYQIRKYRFLLLGDVEDFHGFSMKTIEDAHGDIYGSFKDYGLEKVFRVFGNHDFEWGLNDPLAKKRTEPASEAIILKSDDPAFNGPEIFLTHGQQAEDRIEDDVQFVRTMTWIEKMWASLVGKPRASMFSVAATGFDVKDAIYSLCADRLNEVIICGHTHYPIFSQKYPDLRTIYDLAERTASSCLRQWLEERALVIKGYIHFWTGNIREYTAAINTDRKLLSKKYFNSGACCFIDGITLLEIEGKTIRLVFWNNDDKCKGTSEIIFEGDIRDLTR